MTAVLPTRQIADAIFQKDLAYRDFTPAHTGDSEKSGANQTWLFNPGMRELSRAESDRRAAAGESFALRFRVPRGNGEQVRVRAGEIIKREMALPFRRPPFAQYEKLAE